LREVDSHDVQSRTTPPMDPDGALHDFLTPSDDVISQSMGLKKFPVSRSGDSCNVCERDDKMNSEF
jgi:hypothetical protein